MSEARRRPPLRQHRRCVQIPVVHCPHQTCQYDRHPSAVPTTQPYTLQLHGYSRYNYTTHTHTCLTAVCPGLPRWAGTLQKGKTNLDFTEARDILAGPHCSKQITMPAPHHSVFYRPDALPTVSKHWRQQEITTLLHPTALCLQWSDTVGWVAGRASGLQKLSDEVLVWLSVWSEVQIVCIWSSWCHWHPKSLSSLASFKSTLVLLFWYRLTEVVLEKRPLNRCDRCPRLPRWAGTRRNIHPLTPMRKKKKDSHRQQGLPLSQRGLLDPIKPAYNQYRPDGQLKLTASAFNRL